MATKNVVGLFESSSEAQAVLRDLQAAGFSGDDISLVANNAGGDYGDSAEFDTSARSGSASEAEEGAGFGATGGAVLGGLGGLLVGLGALAIPGIGPVVAAGTLGTALGTTALGAGIGAAAGGLTGALVGAGIPEEDANVYAEGVRRGSTLITVRADDDAEAQRAVDIMNDHGAVDIDDRAAEFRQSGWTRFDETAQPYDMSQRTTTAAATPLVSDVDRTTVDRTTVDRTNVDRTNIDRTNIDREGEIAIPRVEEELRVGKRAVDRGGVRVRTYVEEVPVNEQVTLRDETVNVERRPVDRPVDATTLDAFQEGTFEVREHDEEAVVDKQARVTEEIRINKQAQERTETIQDTVRRTDVEVEQLGTTGTSRTDVTGTNVTGTSASGTTAGDEGAIERGASKLGNAVERGTNTDLDRDGDVGQRDPRNNI